MTQLASPPAQAWPTEAWHGEASLTFTCANGQTRVSQVFTQAPLRVARSHYPEGPSLCYTTLVHTAGGMVGGDRLSQSLTLEPSAQAFVTTPAAAKIYHSTGATSTQSVNIKLAAGAFLEWLPQETIVFNGARYRQTVRVDLAPSAAILLWDLTRFGRSARGETFAAGHWRSDLEIWQGGEPLWIDRQTLTGGSQLLASPSGLNGAAVVGTLALVGRAVDPSELERLRQLGDLPPGQTGMTTCQNGLVCRYRGPSSAAARRYFVQIWQQLRLARCGKIPPMPRIWT